MNQQEVKMSQLSIKELVDRYIDLTFAVHKKGESLVKEQLQSELSNDQFYTLKYIYKTENCTSTELAKVFDVKKSAITAVITKLWDQDLIERTRDQNDRRVVYLTLTEAGLELYKKTEERIYNLVESIITQFEEQEIKQFIETYEKINNILSALQEKQ